jgi:hypothetical protein
MGKDRRALVLQSTSYNGIDFVEVANDTQTALRVHFLNAVYLAGTLGSPPAGGKPGVPPVTISGGERIPAVAVNPINDYADWAIDGSHLVLSLTVRAPGDFSEYTLAVNSPRLDPLFAQARFSFKARCPSDLDCRPPPVVCPVPPSDAPPIDYLAKDFLSFRQALLDFSALRYPEWQERSEADFGMMFLEALCALADDLSYQQDRVAAEAALDTATQRRSVVRLARLVDYEPRPAVAASVLLQLDVTAAANGELPDGIVVSAAGPDGAPIPFETGGPLYDRLIDPKARRLRCAPPTTKVNTLWNSPANHPYRGGLQAYWLDDSQQCLRAGAVQTYVLGAGYNFYPGQALLIETRPATSADPPLRQVVRLTGDAPVEFCDPFFPPPWPEFACPGDPHGTAVTLIRWVDADALTGDRDLALTTLAGNLVPATQGMTVAAEDFVIPPAAPGGPTTAALVRTGPTDTPADPSPQYLYSLANAPLAWLAADGPTQPPRPELVLVLLGPAGDATLSAWQFERWLLTSQPFDTVYTVDPARYSPVAGTVTAAPQYDYDGDAGSTIRFGDGTFGARPDPAWVFRAFYRVGGGAAGNVAAGAITQVDRHWTSLVAAASNPRAASGGDDAEALESVRRLAPQAFRAVQYRAVLPADYEAAAQTLPWVKRAGTVFRWTGSWLTAFTAPDPRGGGQVAIDRRTELIDLLNRYRLAGYESYVPDPKFLSLDLVVEVCAQPSACRGDVEAAALAALRAGPGGFFDPDNFTFGQPLQLSALEAAVQAANGVAGVLCVRYRVRGRTSGFVRMGDAVGVGGDEIIRCDNDPSLPEHGSLQVIIQGGK